MATRETPQGGQESTNAARALYQPPRTPARNAEPCRWNCPSALLPAAEPGGRVPMQPGSRTAGSGTMLLTARRSGPQTLHAMKGPCRFPSSVKQGPRSALAQHGIPRRNNKRLACVLCSSQGAGQGRTIPACTEGKLRYREAEHLAHVPRRGLWWSGGIEPGSATSQAKCSNH